MFSKISIKKIVVGHWNSLRTSTGTRVHLPDVILFYALPLVAAVALFLGGARLTDTDGLLNLAGILFGFLSAIYFFVLERFQASSSRSTNHALFLDQVRHNVGYATITLMVLMVLLVLPMLDIARVATDHGGSAVSSWLTASILALCLHFMLTMLMIIKRVHNDAG